MRIGVVGLGLIGKKRIANLPDDCDLKFICDVNQELVENFIPTSSEVLKTTDYHELVSSEEVDLVVVATTHDNLQPIAMAAIKHGKHVLVEKPGSTNEQLMQELIELAKLREVQIRIGFNHRFHPSFLMAQEIVSSGVHGKLLWIRARYGHGGRVGYDREWRAVKSISGGGELIDQGSHLIDLVRFLVGDVQLAFGETQTSYWKMEVEDNAFVALRPTIGGFAWLHASWTEWKNTFSFEITLENAKIDISGLGGSYGKESLVYYKMKTEMGPPDAVQFQWDASDESWKLEMNDVISGIETGVSIGATGQDAVEVLKIIGEIYNG